MIDQSQTAREKDRLPRGWGRFGKAIDGLVELSEPDETLVACCVGLNPSFQHRTITLVGAMRELPEEHKRHPRGDGPARPGYSDRDRGRPA